MTVREDHSPQVSGYIAHHGWQTQQKSKYKGSNETHFWKYGLAFRNGIKQNENMEKTCF